MITRHRFKVAKLIRDKIPDIMRANKVTVCERIMDAEEYKMRLQDKLIEEAQEVIASATQDHYLEEFADLLEVVHAFSRAVGLSMEQIEQKRAQKKAERGGFDERIYNAWVEMDSDNKNMAYCRARPDDCPEIARD